MAHRFLFILFAVLSFPASVSASYMAQCKLKVKLISLETEIQQKEKWYFRKANFTVLSVREQDGHSDNHCTNYPGKDFKGEISSKNKERLEELTKGDKAILLFRTVTSEMLDKDKVVKMITYKTYKLKAFRFWDYFY
ncbi:MAG: hypothetical protein H7A25_05785 [Leptospiraceae bacterium]|nr:hypothetical protein [Leptospiraceae bacterium]MCP5499392.1 hypothetical protein [Leptospiraceae bacterium]